MAKKTLSKLCFSKIEIYAAENRRYLKMLKRIKVFPCLNKSKNSLKHQFSIPLNKDDSSGSNVVGGYQPSQLIGMISE